MNSIREAAEALLDVFDTTADRESWLYQRAGPLADDLRAALAEKQPGIEELAYHTRAQIRDRAGTNADVEKLIIIALQSAVDAAREEQREADFRIADQFKSNHMAQAIAQAIRGGKA